MSEHLPGLFGLSGVHHGEFPTVVKLGRWFEWPMILLAFWIILEWYIEAQELAPIAQSMYSDWIILGFFVF
jgi:voltage-gated potassium channel